MFHTTSSFVTIHNELAQVPEEYARPSASDTKATEAFQQSAHPDQETFVLSGEPPKPVERIETDPKRDLMPLHRMLPLNAEPIPVMDLPYVSHDGKVMSYWNISEQRDEYVPWFRAAIGGCQGDQATRRRFPHGLKTDDLFCLPGIDLDFDEDEDDVEDEWAAHVAQAIVESTDGPSAISTSSKNAASVAGNKKPATVPQREEMEPHGTTSVKQVDPT